MKEERLRHLSAKAKQKGLGFVVKRGMSKMIAPLYEKKTIYMIVHDLKGDLPPVGVAPEYNHTMLKGEELDLLLRIIEPERLERYRKRIEEGMQCFALMHDDKVVNFFWCSHRDVVDDLIGVRIPVGKTEAYSFDTFTDPQYRGRGLFFSLIVYHLWIGRQVGLERILAAHSHDDLLSVYPKYLKAGIPVRVTRKINYRKFLSRIRVRWSEYNGDLDAPLGIDRGSR